MAGGQRDIVRLTSRIREADPACLSGGIEGCAQRAIIIRRIEQERDRAWTISIRRRHGYGAFDVKAVLGIEARHIDGSAINGKASHFEDKGILAIWAIEQKVIC